MVDHSFHQSPANALAAMRRKNVDLMKVEKLLDLFGAGKADNPVVQFGDPDMAGCQKFDRQAVSHIVRIKQTDFDKATGGLFLDCGKAGEVFVPGGTDGEVSIWHWRGHGPNIGQKFW